MDTALLLARLILAAVFAVAGVAKLVDRQGSQEGLEGFGVPAKLAKPGSVLLPIAEIAVAILLLPTATAWYGSIGALALLLAFIGGIAYNLAKGRTPDCHCFGSLHSEPAGKATLVRNAILSAIAAFVVIGGFDDPGYGLIGWLADLSGAEIVVGIVALLALAAVSVEGWLLVHLLGQNGRVLLRLDVLETMIAEGGVIGEGEARAIAKPAPPAAGLPEGTPAPAFRLEGLHGETMTLDALKSAGKPVLLVFSDPGCGPCNALLPDMGRWQRDHASKLTIAMISRGTSDANRSKVAEHGLTHVLLQKDREVSNDYKANGTPTAVLIRADGMIGSPVAGGVEAIRTLVSKSTGTLALAPKPANGAGNGAAKQAPAAASQRGNPAPDFTLPDLTGNNVSLADLQGNQTLLVFWNPGCGFCKRMVDDLKAWETAPPKSAPKLVLVSTGSTQSNTELGLASTTLLDQGFATGRLFGASGTPSAVLIDAQGKIVSDVAVGSPGVLALANGEEPPKAGNGGAPQAKTSKKGQVAPAVKLQDLDGNTVEVPAKKGDESLLVFWNPGCGFCKKMVDDLKTWETSKPQNAPNVYLVSSGTAKANREQGLSIPILLDDGFDTGRAFGASGTPSAVLIDKNGKIASDVVVGGPAVLALATPSAPKKGQAARA